MTVVIYGPMATGKTFHADRFKRLYACSRVIEGDEPQNRRTSLREDDLVLVACNRQSAARRFPNACIISIEDARRQAGLGPAPDRGYFG